MDVVRCRVVMLGNTGSGKSCLASKFTKDEFYEFQEPTIGAAYQVKTVEYKENQKIVRFEIWDTAGQERYKSLTPMYYKKADIALLCFDITNKESFDGAIYWEKELSEKGPVDCVQFLVGTKCDLKKNEEFNPVNFAVDKNMIYMETSAKTGNNIDNLFRAAGIHEIKNSKNNVNHINERTHLVRKTTRQTKFSCCF